MKKRAVALLLTFSLMICFVSCKATRPICSPSPTQKEMTTKASGPSATPAANPPYKTMNVGSSKTLQGTCLLINIFLSDGECSPFTAAEKKEQMDSLYTAIYCISKHAERYNTPLSFIYNTEDTNIDYAVDYIIPRYSPEDWSYRKLIAEIRLQYDIDALMKKYNADNLSFIVNINKSGHCFASQCDKKIENAEIAFIYNFHGYPDDVPWDEISYDDSSAYTHELLHLFGAIDLYNLDDERLSLAKQYFPNDCMLAGDIDLLDDCTSISPLTAYLIGWTKELDEKYQIFLQ